jgi:hypothetical protein
LKACNTIPVRTDMGEFFFISRKNGLTIVVNNTK